MGGSMLSVTTLLALRALAPRLGHARCRLTVQLAGASPSCGAPCVDAGRPAVTERWCGCPPSHTLACAVASAAARAAATASTIAIAISTACTLAIERQIFIDAGSENIVQHAALDARGRASLSRCRMKSRNEGTRFTVGKGGRARGMSALRATLVAFPKSVTSDRVCYQNTASDHPQLIIARQPFASKFPRLHDSIGHQLSR